MKQPKFIFITGGVVSSLGKGISAGSIGRLLKSRGLKVFMQKLDPYINVDPGTMSPLQHGEVFVTDDGAETDLDLGHYERFIDENLNQHCSVTAGKVYLKVIEKERRGEYKGRTVQVIPHITNQIKEYIWSAAKSSQADIIITEIGGTVGDFESLPFLEAIRQVRRDVGYHNTLYIHTTLVPYLKASGEVKTKPTQHSVKELRSLGINPDVIILRTEKSLPKEQKDKIALFCDVNQDSVIEVKDCKILYEVVNELAKQKLDEILCDHFQITPNKLDLSEWNEMISLVKSSKGYLNIYLAGNYVALSDAYLSLVESLKHASYIHQVQVNVKLINPAEYSTLELVNILSDADGIVLSDSISNEYNEQKIQLVKFARENKIPFIGINNGLFSVIYEYAKYNKLINIDKYIIESPKTIIGLHKLVIQDADLVRKAYQKQVVFERFRSDWVISRDIIDKFNQTDLILDGILNNEFVSMVEMKNHPWFIACQFHPEFLSRPNRPHPLFVQFLKAIIDNKKI